MILRQSTAQTIRFGPFLDDTDFKTAETALTIAQADRQISKDGGAFAQSNHTGTATHDTDGWYSDDLDATDTNTVGELILQVVVAGALPVWRTFYVVEEAVYDALYGASAAGPLQSTTAGRTLDVAATGEAGVDLGNVTGTLTGGQLGVGAFAAGAITAAALATDAANEIRDAVTGGAYSLDTDSNGRVRIVDGTGTGEVNTLTGGVDVRMFAGNSTAVAVSANDYLQVDAKEIDETLSISRIPTLVWTSAIASYSGSGGSFGQWAAGSARRLLAVTTIATLTSQSSFTLTAGSADDKAYRGCLIVIEDATTGEQRAVGTVDTYTGATKTVGLLENPGVFTMAVGDKVTIFAQRTIVPTDYALNNAYHANVGADGVVEANVMALRNDGGAALNQQRFFNATGYNASASTVGTASNVSAIAANAVNASALATDAVNEIRNAITGGAYALSSDANGRVRIVDGTAAGELDTTSGRVEITGTKNTLDALNDLSSAGAQAAADAALVALHLDHLLAVDYDPASKPGVATALLNELIESNGGVSRYTAPALAQAPSGGDATAANQTAIVNHLTDVKGAGWVAADNLAEIAEDVTGLNGDPMRGTDSAALASAYTAGRAANLDNLDATVSSRSTLTQAQVTGGAYSLDTDSNGRVRLVDGTGAGEVDTLTGTVALRAATQASIDAIEADSNELQTDWADGGRLDLILDARASQASLDALNDLSAAQVNAEVLDVLNVDKMPELPQAQPPATPTVFEALMLAYMAHRNKKETTAGEYAIFNDADAKIAKKLLTEDGTTFTDAKMTSGA